ncbi:MAG: VTT domain-containing protein [Propioniciclava sp.]|uniref:DedA family protein n=1 Tax=Propioniciclava sp. TaxID=2038686 RepID=UPI0039E35DAB
MTNAPSPHEPEATTPEPEWWDDPALPWRHEPQRADFICMGGLSVVAIYGLVMLPLRPVMLGLAPHLLGSLGYRTGMVLVGALAATGDPWWPLVLVLASAAAMKFDWIYWWAGKLWGRNIMDVWATNRSPRTQRYWQRVWDGARRYAVPAILLTYLPLPLPAGVIYAALGAAGTRLRTFLLVDAVGALASTAGYLALGYWLGEPAVQVVDTYGRYLWYVSIAILVGMLAVFWYRSRKKADA